MEGHCWRVPQHGPTMPRVTAAWRTVMTLPLRPPPCYTAHYSQVSVAYMCVCVRKLRFHPHHHRHEGDDGVIMKVMVKLILNYRAGGKVELLYKCVRLLVSMLDYPDHIWDLQPWQKLTQVLCKFYQAWIRYLY